MAAIETIPNAFWSALNNQNLNDLLPPRWSILVNDAGVQVNITLWVFIDRGVCGILNHIKP